jgi:hypothetical protein
MSTEVTSEIMPACPGQRGGNDHAGLAAAFLLGAGRVDDDAPRRLVALGDVRCAGELEPYRAHPHRDLARVPVVAEALGQLGTGQARRNLGDVVKELPDLLNRLGDLEPVLDQHRVSLSR